MGYRLREGVSYCIAAGKTVLFDLPNCRYTALPDDVDDAFQALAQRKTETREQVANLSAMVDAGLLVHQPDEATSLPTAAMKPASRSALDSPLPTATLSRISNAVLAQATAGFGLKAWRLEAIFNRLQRQSGTCRAEPVPMDELASISSAFYWSERIISSGEKCLRRSIALADYLRRKRIPCDLILGVRMRPFAAHAWVQHGELVLNESLDEVRRYTTILVV